MMHRRSSLWCVGPSFVCVILCYTGLMRCLCSDVDGDGRHEPTESERHASRLLWTLLNPEVYLQRALVAIKILLGLGQIMSKQPSALKEKFPVRSGLFLAESMLTQA